MIYPSFHISRVQIPSLDQFLLFQTMRGAVDIVAGDVARELDHCGESDSTLSEAEMETLKRRGYLTELSASEEQEQARTILRVLSEKLQSPVELVFRFASSGPAVDVDDIIDTLFSLVNKIAGEQPAVLIRLEIAHPYIDAQLITHILDEAQAHNGLVLPRVTIAALDALTPWVKSENFRQVLISSDGESMSLDVDGTANNIITFFDQQVHPAWKCHVDGMTSEQLEAMLAIFKRVRQRYPFFSLHLISDRVNDNRLTVNHTSLPFISQENESVLNTLWSFIRLPQRINYKPFFASRPHKLTFDLDTKRVTYEPATGADTIGCLEQIRARFNDATARPPIEPEAAMASIGTLIDDRLSCKYALICGSNCGIHDGDGRQCGEVYEQRVQQVLPLLFFNLQKDSQQ